MHSMWSNKQNVEDSMPTIILTLIDLNLVPFVGHSKSLNKLLSLALCLGLWGCGEINNEIGPNSTSGNFSEVSSKHGHETNCTIRSVKNGHWRKEKTWNQARVPGQGDTVCIERKHRIKYDIEPHAAEDLRAVVINGRLSFNERKSRRCESKTLKKGGKLQSGE